MSLSTSVGFKLGVDSGTLDSDLAKASAKVDKFAKQTEQKTKAAEGAAKKAGGGGGRAAGGGDGGLLGGVGKGIANELGIGGITGIAGAATLAVGAVAALGKAALDMAGDLVDAAENMDMSIDKVQELQQFFGEAGVGPEKFGAAMASLSGKVQSAKEGNLEAQQSLQKLGIGFNDLFALSPDEMIGKIADSSKDAANKGQLLADLTDVLGKNAKKMIGPLSQGKDAIKEVGDSMTKMSDVNAKALDSLGDKFSRFWTSIQAGTGNAMGDAVRKTMNTWSVLTTGKDDPNFIKEQAPKPTPAQTAAQEAAAKIKKQKEADAESDRIMAEAAAKIQEKMREESEKGETHRHEMAMKADEEIRKMEEDKAKRQMSFQNQQKDGLKELMHIREQMQGQDANGRKLMELDEKKKNNELVAAEKKRLSMTADQRRQADRNERKEAALERKAQRIVDGKEREERRKMERNAKLEDRKVPEKQVAPIAKEANAAATMENAADKFATSVDALTNLKVVAITNG